MSIYWLASYPKSGNTWMRIFLTNYWRNSDIPADINQLETTTALNSSTHFDNLIQVESGHLVSDEINLLRPAYYRAFVEKLGPEPVYCKTHDALQRLPDNSLIMPPDVTAGVIYIVRSPLDVAISYAHHNGHDVDKSIEWMADDAQELSKPTASPSYQLPQRLMSWSSHVKSWVQQSELPIFVVRYEDMLSSPLETFTSVIRFIGADEDPVRIQRAIHQSSFKELKSQEAQREFIEKPPRAASFFRQGTSGDWQAALTPAQIERIVQDHREVMQRFNYLPFE